MNIKRKALLPLTVLLLLADSNGQSSSRSSSSSSSTTSPLPQLIERCKQYIHATDKGNYTGYIPGAGPVRHEARQAATSHIVTPGANRRQQQQQQQLVVHVAGKLAHNLQQHPVDALQACQEAARQLLGFAAVVHLHPAAAQPPSAGIQLGQHHSPTRLRLLSSSAEPSQASQNSRRKKARRIQPRLSIHTISDMPDRRMYKMLYLMALDEFMNHGPETGDSSYHAIAGIHGAVSPYNGYQPQGTGFCRHADSAFGPWHRPYVLLFEQHLRQACKSAIRSFRDPNLKADADYTCDTLRAPYWDYTDSRTPDILTRQSVLVYSWTGQRQQLMSNPLLSYCFRAVAETSVGIRYPGMCISRSSSWTQAMSAAANSFREQALGFLASGSWYCTNRANGGGCPGNLEVLHNNVHNVVGGDMSRLSTSGWDPIFWLHHSNVDRLLFLYQVNAGDYFGDSSYIPFPAEVDCGARTTECDYIYQDSAQRLGSSSTPQQQQQQQRSSDALLHFNIDQRLGDPASPQALDYFQSYLEQLQGGYNGYRWSIVIDGVNPYALRPSTYALHVLIKHGRCAAGATVRAGQELDLELLRSRAGYCGSNAGFVSMDPAMMTHDQNTSVVINIQSCLQRCGLNPNILPLNPNDPTEGPRGRPLNGSMVQVLCIRQSPDGQAGDCSSEVVGSVAVRLGWSLLTPRFEAASHTFAPEQYRAWLDGVSGAQGGNASTGHAGAISGAAMQRPKGTTWSNGATRQYHHCQAMEL